MKFLLFSVLCYVGYQNPQGERERERDEQTNRQQLIIENDFYSGFSDMLTDRNIEFT